MISLACDVGGTAIKLGLVRGGAVLARAEVPAEAASGWAGALERIAGAAPGLWARARTTAPSLAAVGVAFPGIIEPGTQRILSTPSGKFDDARGTDLRGSIQQRFGVPCVVCNDANAALAGEWRYGAGRGCRSVVMVTLGTGIGTAAIVDGVPLRGQHGQAGCLGGHLVTQVEGRNCRCGNVGCAEAAASTWALAEMVREHRLFPQSALRSEAVVGYASLFRAARAGDALALEMREQSLQVWSALVVSLIHAYDPERVILGGGVMRSAEDILPAVSHHVRRHAWTPWGTVQVAAAELGNDAGLIGIASIASECIKEPIT